MEMFESFCLKIIKQKNTLVYFFLKFIQVAIQLLSVVVAASWAFILTFVILQLVGLVPFLRLKLTEEEEKIGSDLVELGERACML